MKSNNNSAYYMGLPYTIVLKRDEDGDFVGRIEELQGCVAHGKDESEAILSLKRIQELWILDCLDSGEPIPLPKEDTPLPSGKWVQRVPRSLHKKLSERAEQEEVSLNQLVTSILSESVGSKVMQKCVDDSLIAYAGRFAASASAAPAGMWGENESPWRIGGAQIHRGGITQHLSGITAMMMTPYSEVNCHDYEKEH